MQILKLGILTACLAIATQGFAFGSAQKGNFGACQQSFANGTPPVVAGVEARRATALCFDGFATLYSGSTKTPIYSAEVQNAASIRAAKGEERTDRFYPEARLPFADRAQLSDYAHSGLDRGHQFAAADASTPESMAQTFSLANMVPQFPLHNRKLWSGIEQATRKYILRAAGNVYVVTGSLLIPGQCPITASNCAIGNGVVVPSHIYKLVYDATTRRAWAYWTENSDNARASAPITYQELVKRTGIEFLPGLSPAN